MPSDEPRFTVAAYAVVTNDDRDVLLTRRRDSEHWVLPGGSVEESESPWDGVVREVREETSVEISVERLVGVYAKPRESDLVFAFAAVPVGGSPRPSDERDRVAYFDRCELPSQVSERDRERIQDAFNGADRAILTVQPSAGDRPPPGTR